MQQSFSDFEYQNRRRKTKREEFLDTMDRIVPWSEWVCLIKPYYFKGKRGRPPLGIEKMLRMYLLQLWFNLSDEALEDAVYDSFAMRKFMGLNFNEEQVPDATTLLKFRHLLEENNLGEQMLSSLNRILDENGYIMQGGTVVDASIFSAPSSTKNREGKRDSQMHQTKKGNQWYFGMKFHVGVDAGTGYVHSTAATAANVHDINKAAELIRPEDQVVYGDSGYIGLEKRSEITFDPVKSEIDYQINKKPGKIRKGPDHIGKQWDRQIERRKSSVRSKVEHPFHIVKNIFGYRKLVYRGIQKNRNRLNALFASANLFMLARSGRVPLISQSE